MHILLYSLSPTYSALLTRVDFFLYYLFFNFVLLSCIYFIRVFDFVNEIYNYLIKCFDFLMSFWFNFTWLMCCVSESFIQLKMLGGWLHLKKNKYLDLLLYIVASGLQFSFLFYLYVGTSFCLYMATL